MPRYQEGKDMTESEVMSLVTQLLDAHLEKQYQKLTDLPLGDCPPCRSS